MQSNQKIAARQHTPDGLQICKDLVCHLMRSQKLVHSWLCDHRVALSFVDPSCFATNTNMASGTNRNRPLGSSTTTRLPGKCQKMSSESTLVVGEPLELANYLTWNHVQRDCFEQLAAPTS